MAWRAVEWLMTWLVAVDKMYLLVIDEERAHNRTKTRRAIFVLPWLIMWWVASTKMMDACALICLCIVSTECDVIHVQSSIFWCIYIYISPNVCRIRSTGGGTSICTLILPVRRPIRWQDCAAITMVIPMTIQWHLRTDRRFWWGQPLVLQVCDSVYYMYHMYIYDVMWWVNTIGCECVAFSNQSSHIYTHVLALC